MRTQLRSHPARDGAAGDRSGRWRVDPGFGVYVHIPFCLHRCHYCDFNTYEGLEGLHLPYVEALIGSIESWAGPTRPATSVFFGGGTPTLLGPEELARVLGAVRRRVGVAPGAEITVEANPETVDEPTFEALLQAGFNRFSIGVQSLAAPVLAKLGRTHSADGAMEAFAAARRAGASDVNVDLIYGSPWEDEHEWAWTLERIVEAGPDHVSAYALTIEEGTPLATLVRTGRSPDVDPDVQAERHARAQEVLGSAGYARYETSNWARPGRCSRHNVLYWCAGDYLAFGAGAHGHVTGRRWWLTARPRDFIAAIEARRSPEAGHERLSAEQHAGEALMLGLRLTSGVHLEGFARRWGPAPLERRSGPLAVAERDGLIERSGGWLRLSSRATLLGDEVARRLM